MPMFITSKNTGRKIYHTSFCTYAKRIRQENSVEHENVKNLRENGYRACNCCSPMGRRFRTEKAKLMKFAKEHQMKVWLYDNAVYMETLNGSWKVMYSCKERKMCLYHANTEIYRNCKIKDGKIQHTYHEQTGAHCTSLMGFAGYIYRHDNWRRDMLDSYKEMPHNTEKQKRKYKNEKRKSDKKKIHNVLNLIESLKIEREYREGKIIS